MLRLDQARQEGRRLEEAVSEFSARDDPIVRLEGGSRTTRT
jgi:hypothetical protein